VLEGDVQSVGCRVAAHIVYHDDAGVREPGGRPGLGEEALLEGLCLLRSDGKGELDRLQRDRSAQLRIRRAPDHSHGPATELLLDEVAVDLPAGGSDGWQVVLESLRKMMTQDRNTAGYPSRKRSRLTATRRDSTIVGMENVKSTPRSIVVLLSLLAFSLPAAAGAGALPSRAQEDPPASGSAADRARIEAVLARQEVAQALAAHGIAREDVEHRLAQLSPEDLRSVARNVDQVQAAGTVPNYIWILLAIFLAVSILAVVL
jgi:hypothetical protein